MSTAYLVLLFLLIIYIPIYVWVRLRPAEAERYHLVKYGPCIMIKTKLGLKMMDRLGKYTRFWRAFGFVSKIITAVLLIMMMYMLVKSLQALPSRLASGSSIGIEYALAIPGFNPILPLSFGIVALFVAMVVHEMGHGIQSRANDIKVDSSGLLYGVVPLGAFVEPNEADMEKKTRRARMDVYAAGITVNTVLAVIAMVFLSSMGGCITTDMGNNAGVYQVDMDSPAYEAGIPTSAIITEIREAGGTEWKSCETVTYDGRVAIDYCFDPTQRYSITYLDEDGQHTVDNIQMGAYIRSVVVDAPANKYGISYGTFLYSIIINGEETLVSDPVSFSKIMANTESGQAVIVKTVGKDSADIESHEVILSGSPTKDCGYLGLVVTTGGLTLTTPNIMLDASLNPFYNSTDLYSYFTGLLGYLSGPFNGMDPISDEVKWWYDVPAEDVFWIIMSLLYWIFWLDLLLAISNALPAYPFDGGFLFRGFVSWSLEKMKYKEGQEREDAVNSISNSVSTLVLFVFALVIISMLV